MRHAEKDASPTLIHPARTIDFLLSSVTGIYFLVNLRVITSVSLLGCLRWGKDTTKTGGWTIGVGGWSSGYILMCPRSGFKHKVTRRKPVEVGILKHKPA